MYLALVLTNTVDVLLQQSLFLICINTGEVKPMVATKLLGFEPIRLKYFEKWFSDNVVTDWSLFHLLAASVMGDLLTLKKRPM